MTEFKTKEISSEEKYTSNRRDRRKGNGKSKCMKTLLVLVLLTLAIGAYFFFSYNNYKSKILVDNDLIVNIEVGDNFTNLPQKVIDIDSIWYPIYIRNNKPDFELNAGSYKIKGGSDIAAIVEGLKYPITEEVNIVILEGWNIYDIDKCLSNPEYFAYTREGIEYTCMFKTEAGDKVYIKSPLINAGEYIDYVTNTEKIKALSEFYPFLDDQTTLEGFLYPDTYKIDGLNFKINNFVIKQLDTFETKVYNKLLTGMSSKQVTDLVNLASIVEKEERNSAEKPTVAGILKKRLDNGWMIGADITVCYPHELTSNECKMVVSKYINEKSDYNTRTMVGLPKTPIGNPNYETIDATLNYKNTEYWYYLHNVSTGKIYYAKTNAEHEANKAYMY